MSEYQDFTSLPPDQERSFVVYERRTQETGKKAWTIGGVAAGVIGLFIIVTVLSHDAPVNQHAEDMMRDEMAAEKDAERERPKRPAPTASDDADEASADGEEAEEGESAAGESAEGESAAGEGSEAEAPKPPKGATKAPPTALTN